MPIPPPTDPAQQPPIIEFWKGTKEWFTDFIDLREGMDREGASESIQKGKLMRGSNAWMLVCSIMIASLGLDLNSGAVIIGAMLISPLMNPILGLGLGVATNDREALSTSVRHFFISIAIALITSTFYFWLTPLKDFTSEMAARTQPNILDGLVAVFGGLAGIISITRADKTNAIPGVAIATALMPPLCVSGYGLATGEWGIAARAFYLFFLNSSIIAVSAYLIIRLLRFPYRTYVNKKEARRSQLLVGFFSLLILVPSVVIMLEVVADVNVNKGIRDFVQKEFKSSCLEYKYLQVNPDSNLLVMELYNRDLSPDSIKYFEGVLSAKPYRVKNTQIVAIPDNKLNLQRLDRFQFQLSALDNLEEKLSELMSLRENVASSNQQLANELATYRLDSAGFKRFNEQLRLAFPDLLSFSLARAQISTEQDSLLNNMPLAVIRREKVLRSAQLSQENDRLRNFLKLALKVDTVVLVSQ